MTGLGDLYPFASLKWNRRVHNFMAYVTAGIPSGAYDANRQSTVGLGHWAVDGGGGYTYFDETKGHEFSAVLGFTYNFMNPSTLYQSGIDLHLELSASQYLTERLYAGAVGYFYNQITADSGPGASLGPCSWPGWLARARRQASDFVLGRRDASLNVRGYYEFAGENRPQGWNAWVTLVIALARPESRPQWRGGRRRCRDGVLHRALDPAESLPLGASALHRRQRMAHRPGDDAVRAGRSWASHSSSAVETASPIIGSFSG